MQKTLISLFSALSINYAVAAEPVQNADAIENELKQCLLKVKETSTCASEILGKRIVPGYEKLIPVAKQVDDLIIQWLANETIYAIHPVKKVKAGSFFDKRTYIIEDNSGALLLMNISFISRLGKLHVFSFDVNTDGDEILKVIKEGS